jgi:hypothetical protein
LRINSRCSYEGEGVSGVWCVVVCVWVVECIWGGSESLRGCEERVKEG